MLKFIGVYSGRLYTKHSLDAQIGMVWPGEAIFRGSSNQEPYQSYQLFQGSLGPYIPCGE